MTNNEQRETPRSTLSIDTTINAMVIPEIDDSNYLLLGRSSCNRSELMVFAMAVGWKNRISIPIEKAASGGFARTEYFSDEMMTKINLLHLAKIGFDNSDELRNINEGYHIFEEYVNGGFNIIRSELDQSIDSEERANDIISELDIEYNSIFSS